MSGFRGEQVHLLCAVEELMPSIGTVVPSPAVLAATIWQSESIFRHIGKQCQDLAQTHSFITDTNLDQNSCQGTMTYLTSISEDGKIWSWLLKFDKSALPNKSNLGANLHGHSSAMQSCIQLLNQLMFPFLSLILGRNQVDRAIVMRQLPTHAPINLILQ